MTAPPRWDAAPKIPLLRKTNWLSRFVQLIASACAAAFVALIGGVVVAFCAGLLIAALRLSWEWFIV